MGTPFKGSAPIVRKALQRYTQHSNVTKLRQGLLTKQAQLQGLVTDLTKHPTVVKLSQGVHNLLVERVTNLAVASQTKVTQYVNYENVDRLKESYYEIHDWLMGVAVSQAQDEARYLETRLNSCRKNLKDERDSGEMVTEELRSIIAELEHTSRGDSKNLILRQKEYECIQKELKVQKEVTRAEFAERETFTLLMNAVRVHQETERNHRHQMSFLSIGFGILGTCVGFLLTWWTNSWRFAKIESTLIDKVQLFRDQIKQDMMEFHGILPEVVVEEVKPSILSRTVDLVASVYHALVPPLEGAEQVPVHVPQPAIVEAVSQSTVATQVVTVVTEAVIDPVVAEPSINMVAAPTVTKVVQPTVIERIVPGDCSGHKAELELINSNYEAIMQSMLKLQSSVAALTPTALTEPAPAASVVIPPPAPPPAPVVINLPEDLAKSNEYIIEALEGLKSSKTAPNVLEVSKLLEIQKTVLTTLTSLSNITQSNHADLVTVLGLLQENMITNTGDLCEGSVHLSNLSHNVTELAARIAGVEGTSAALLSMLDEVSDSITALAAHHTESNSVSSQASDDLASTVSGYGTQLTELRDQVSALSIMLDTVKSSTTHSEEAIADVVLQLQALSEIEQGGVSTIGAGLEHLTNVLCYLQQQGHDAEEGQLNHQRELQSLKEKLDEVHLLVTLANEAIELARVSSELRETERREGELREGERIGIEKLAAEQMASERLAVDTERLEVERREVDRLAAEIRETQRVTDELRETQRQDTERWEAHRVEAEAHRVEAEARRAESERRDIEKTRLEREESERRGAEQAKVGREEALFLKFEREERARQEAYLPDHPSLIKELQQQSSLLHQGESTTVKRGSVALLYTAFVVTSTIIAAFFKGPPGL